MKRGLILGAVVSHLALFSQGISTDSLDKEEAFMVKRITEFWKDQDYTLVQRQIHLFLDKYPNSSLKDYLKGVLGDIYLKDREFDQAINTYLSIDDPKIQEKVLVNTLQAMYEQSRYADIYKVGAKYLQRSEIFEERKDEYLFLMAEGYFRSTLEMGDLEAQDLLQDAKNIYEKLLKTSYNDPSQFALAEIYKKTNEPQKSAELFKMLAAKFKDKKEELLFHAALAESIYNPHAAIETFAEVVEMGGSKLYTSAFNRVVLLFQLENYEAVVGSMDVVLANVDQQSLPLVLYMYSRSLYGSKMYAKALEVLDRLESKEGLDESQRKNLYLIELGSTQQLKEIDRYEVALQQFEITFPKDREVPKAIFIHALLLKEHSKTAEAQQQLEKIIKQFADFENPDSLMLEYGLITYDNEKYELSRSSLKNYINSFPASDQIHLAWRYYLSATLQLFDLIQKDSDLVEDFSKIQFFSDLSWILSDAKGLTDKEIQETRYLQAKVGFDLGYTQETMQRLLTYIQDYSKHGSVSDAHLLLSLCYDRLRTNYEGFIDHAEKAVESAQRLENLSSMHIQIFNALLRYKEDIDQLSSLSQDQIKRLQEINEKAANHLYQAFSRNDLEIRKENLLWLSNIFYDQSPIQTNVYGPIETVETALPTNLAKAKQILQKILVLDQEPFPVLVQKNPNLEWDMMRLIRIVSKEGNLAQKRTYLELLTEAYRNHAYVWNLRQESLIELAKCYEIAGNKKQALDCYFEATSVSNVNRTMASEYARIHKIRLELDQLDQFSPEQLEEKINYLKGLQIQKEVSSEPLHLEASLVYVDARAKLSDMDQRDEKYLFFLSRLKDDFDNSKDPQTISYSTDLSSNPKIKKLYDTYMQLVTCEMLFLKSKIEEREEHTQEANLNRLEGLKALGLLKKEKYLTHYLSLKIDELSRAFE